MKKKIKTKKEININYQEEKKEQTISVNKYRYPQHNKQKLR